MVEASPQRANMGFIGAIVAVATIGGLLFGYDSGAVNGTQEGLRTAFDLSDAGLGFTVGSLLIGCAVGAFFAGRLADVIGRRNVMMLAAILFVFGALVQGFAAHRRRCSSSPASPAAWRSARRACSRPRTSPRWPRRTSAAG